MARAGEMAQRLTAYTILAEDLSSVPSTRVREFTTACKPVPGGFNTFGLCRHLHSCVHTHTKNLKRKRKLGLERWLNGWGYWLFFQRTRVWIPAPTWFHYNSGKCWVLLRWCLRPTQVFPLHCHWKLQWVMTFFYSVTTKLHAICSTIKHVIRVTWRYSKQLFYIKTESSVSKRL